MRWANFLDYTYKKNNPPNGPLTGAISQIIRTVLTQHGRIIFFGLDTFASDTIDQHWFCISRGRAQSARPRLTHAQTWSQFRGCAQSAHPLLTHAQTRSSFVSRGRADWALTPSAQLNFLQTRFRREDERMHCYYYYYYHHFTLSLHQDHHRHLRHHHHLLLVWYKAVMIFLFLSEL